MHNAFNTLHRHHFKFSAPFLSIASILQIVADDDNGDSDDPVHVMSRWRCRIATLARDCCSSEKSLYRRYHKYFVINITQPLLFYTACQNDLDHHRRSGTITIYDCNQLFFYYDLLKFAFILNQDYHFGEFR